MISLQIDSNNILHINIKKKWLSNLPRQFKLKEGSAEAFKQARQLSRITHTLMKGYQTLSGTQNLYQKQYSSHQDTNQSTKAAP